MTFRAVAIGSAGSSSSTSCTVTIPATVQVGDVLTFAVVKQGGGGIEFSISSDNGGTFEQIAPVSGIGQLSSSQGRFNVFRRVAVAGDAGSVVTVSNAIAGRMHLAIHAQSGVGPQDDVAVYTSSGTSGGTFTMPAADPLVGSAGGTAVYFALGDANNLQLTYSSTDVTIRGQATHASSTHNVSVAIADDTFAGAAQVPTQVITASAPAGSRAQVTVLYSSGVATPPIVDAGPDLTVLVDSTVTITATASDPDGTIASRLWEQLSGPAVTLTGAITATVGFTAPAAPGTIVLRYTATDNGGLATSDDVTVTVAATGQIARPSSDVTTTAVVKAPTDAASFAATIDEATGDDADYVEFNTGAVYAFDLAPLAPTTGDTGWALVLRLSKTVATGAHSVRVRLTQGATTVKTVTYTDLTTTPVTKTITLSAPEAASIPNRTQPLRVTLDNVTA